MVSEDRKGEGLAGGMSVADNLTLTNLEGFGVGPIVLRGRQHARAAQWTERLGIRARDVGQAVGELSGGNQQKVAIGRLLHHDVDVLLLDEPTKGIDVASKAQIYALLDSLVAEHAPRPRAILLVSSYFPELLGLCDRVAVMHKGRLVLAHARRKPHRTPTRHGGDRRRNRRVNRRRVLDNAGPLLGLLFVSAIFGFLIGPRFFSGVNLELIARQTAIICTAALGMTMVIIAGGIDLSVGSSVALTTVVIAVLLRGDAGPLVAATAGIGAAALVGAINGALITSLRVIPFIVTLGTMILVRGAAKGVADERRVEAPTTWLNDLLRTVDAGQPADRARRDLAGGGSRLLVAGTLGYTRFGRHLFAIGSNERTARLCGVPLGRTRIAVYTAAGALAGVAGLLQFARLSVGDPTVAVGLELDVIAAVIIGGGSLSGGRGSVLGTVLGASTMAVITIGCAQQGLPNWVQQIVTGAIIVLAVALDRARNTES